MADATYTQVIAEIQHRISALQAQQAVEVRAVNDKFRAAIGENNRLLVTLGANPVPNVSTQAKAETTSAPVRKPPPRIVDPDAKTPGQQLVGTGISGPKNRGPTGTPPAVPSGVDILRKAVAGNKRDGK